MGTALARRRPLRRLERLRARLRPAQRLALSRLRHSLVQPRQAVNVFLREQIAGDELDWVTNDSLIATGFLRNYAKVGFREKDNPEFRYEYLDDMIATIGRGILGLTVQCARCHNHKFDPIPQKDYYRLQASLFGYVEVDHPLTTPERPQAYEKKLADVTARAERGSRTRSARSSSRTASRCSRRNTRSSRANVQAAIATPEAERTPGQVLLANQVIRTVSVVSSAEIDRIMKPEDLARKKDLRAADRGDREGAPGAASRWPWGSPTAITASRPTARATNPRPAKASRREAIEGSFLHTGPGRYNAAAVLLPDSRRRE